MVKPFNPPRCQEGEEQPQDGDRPEEAETGPAVSCLPGLPPPGIYIFHGCHPPPFNLFLSVSPYLEKNLIRKGKYIPSLSYFPLLTIFFPGGRDNS